MKKFIQMLVSCILIFIFILSMGCTGPSELFKESEKTNTKDVFSKLLITDTSLSFPEFKKTGLLQGKLTNSSGQVLGGNFKVIFYSANGGINKVYNTPIPGSGLKPGETKVFSLKIDKFDFETYDFIDDNIFIKE